MENILNHLKSAIILLILFTLLTGFIYPALVTGIAQLFFPWQANGSLIKDNDKTIGSVLIGQSFSDVKYFWSRPSATTPFPYNPENSSGSNLGPSNPALLAAVKERVIHLHNADPSNNSPIPVDLVTASASGLDPDISPMAAIYQVHRIALARGIPEQDILNLIQGLMIEPGLGIFGKPRVNVLQLNMALDKFASATTSPKK